MKNFEIFVTLVGVLMSLGYYPQIYKILKTKSAKDVSLISYIIFSFGTTTWFIYGVVKKDPIIFFGFIFGVIGSILVLFLKIFYKNK